MLRTRCPEGCGGNLRVSKDDNHLDPKLKNIYSFQISNSKQFLFWLDYFCRLLDFIGFKYKVLRSTLEFDIFGF